MFPRLDIEKELVKLEKANSDLIEKRKALKEKKKMEENKEIKEEKKEEKIVEDEEEIITIDDFAKVKLKVAKVIDCTNHPKADKLLVLTLKIGDETRTVVSGIKEYYKPEDLVGKKVIVVANLKPVKLRGIESKGMILAAEDEKGNLTLLSTLEEIEDGASIS